jgi:hypothetical protein
MPEGDKPGNVWRERRDALASWQAELQEEQHVSHASINHSLVQECLGAAEASGSLIWVERSVLLSSDRMVQRERALSSFVADSGFLLTRE